jgi:hypothetical protein
MCPEPRSTIDPELELLIRAAEMVRTDEAGNLCTGFGYAEDPRIDWNTTKPDFSLSGWSMKSKEDVTAEDIKRVTDEIREFLLEKNRKYGDSALTPSRIFSRADSIEQIKVRIDDKINRMKNRQDDEDEDVEWDLLGYLILLRVARIRQERAENPPKIDYNTVRASGDPLVPIN